MSAAVSDVAQLWRAQLVQGDKGQFKACLPNVMKTFRLAPQFAGLLTYDAFAERVRLSRATPWGRESDWREVDSAYMAEWLQSREGCGINVAPAIIDQALVAVAKEREVHPVREYLDPKKTIWDKQRRVETWLSTYAGVEDTPYARDVARIWLVSAVARVMVPGEKVDTTPILEGPQGVGKTRLVQALVPREDWCAETGITIGDKDSYLALHGVWIYLLDELDSLRRGDITKVKSFLTARRDWLRPPYGRSFQSFLRQTVFAGTTNEREYFGDVTGNRRYLPVRVGRVEVDALLRDRDQLWAEARALYDDGVRWWLDGEESKARAHDQTEIRRSDSPWRNKIEGWLIGHPTPTIEEVLSGAIGLETKDMTEKAAYDARRVLTELGFSAGPRHREGGVRIKRYSRAASG